LISIVVLLFDIERHDAQFGPTLECKVKIAAGWALPDHMVRKGAVAAGSANDVDQIVLDHQ
jgi:hypothetical protein